MIRALGLAMFAGQAAGSLLFFVMLILGYI